MLGRRPTLPDRKGRLGVFFLTLVSFALNSAGVELQISVVMAPEEGVSAPHSVSLSAIPIMAVKGLTSAQRRETEAGVPGKVHLDLPPNTSWRLELRADGYWAEASMVDLEAEGQTVEVTLYRAGWIEGVIRPPRGETPPDEAEVRLQPSPDASREAPPVTVSCPLSNNLFRCLVPAGKLDFRIRAPGYLAHYFWDVAVPWRGDSSLGSLELRRGASVVGWIETPTSEFEGAEVDLSPQLAGFAEADSMDSVRHRHGSMSLTAEVNHRGFFQVPSVPPGNYVLTARHPALASAKKAPIVVKDGQETELDPIELQPLASLNVALSPPRDPFHKAWRLSLSKQSADPSHYDRIKEGVASDLGTWDVPTLEPAVYWLHVDDSRGSSWASEDVTVRHDAPPLEIELPVIRLEGYVTLGGEPVPSPTAYLTEHWGGAKTSVRGTEEGRFYVFLPKGKTWDVEIEQVQLQVIGKFKEVQVPARRAGDRWPKVEFEIPDTTIEGRVVMADGTRLPEPAMIDVSGGSARTYKSGETGDFELRGVEPGEIYLQARLDGRDLRSATIRTAVEDGERIGPIELELHADIRLTGMVLSPSGIGIPGARVVIGFASGPNENYTGSIPEGYTDMDGVFDIPLPATTRGVLVTAFPPGFAVTQERFSDPKTSPPLVTAEEAGGTVIVDYEGAEDLDPVQRAQLNMRMALIHDFMVGHVFALGSWAQLHGISEPRRFVIPMLEPGRYAACVDANATRLAFKGLTLPPEVEGRCASGNLAPNGELVLQIPASVWRPVVVETPGS